jgi:hypothetical protein
MGYHGLAFMLSRRVVSFLFVASFAVSTEAAPSRFVVDDDTYLERIATACSKLLEKGKLKSADVLRNELHTGGTAVKLAPLSNEKLSPPDLCDRLRESTLAIGSYYKCPDCNEWHFNSSGGFVVSADGVVCTCCHVIMAQDEGVKESYLAAADSNGRVFPVLSVMAADQDADTCFVKIDAHGLKPLALRPGVRSGERIYCLSHPGGYHYMFTGGMVARVNLRRDEAVDEKGQTNGLMTRPILYLNVTAEFAPGSSGAPMVDESGNVVGQVSSIAESGEPSNGDTNNAPSPSVPVRFCVAAEEIARLTNPRLKYQPVVENSRPLPQRFSHRALTNQPAPAKQGK